MTEPDVISCFVVLLSSFPTMRDCTVPMTVSQNKSSIIKLIVWGGVTNMPPWFPGPFPPRLTPGGAK